MWKSIQEFLWGTCTVGATVSISALSLIGMYFLTPALWLCVAAFVLAGAYEGQVNSEGIRGALDRMFDDNRLKVAIVKRYLDELDETLYPRNIFLKNYTARKKYIKDLKKYISDLEIKKQHYFLLTQSKELEKIEEEIAEATKELKKEKECLRRQQLFFLKELYQPTAEKERNTLENAVADLIANNAESIKKEILRKRWAIRLGWPLSLSVGTATGLAGLSAINSGIVAFGLLSLVPGGPIFALAVMAGVGYALLIYQSMSDMIEDFKLQALKDYFKKREAENESTGLWITRCVLVVVAILLATAAMIAMAGTWYRLVRDGAGLLSYVDRVANTLRDVLVLVTALPNLVFTVSNSAESADRLVKQREHYKKWFLDTCTDVVNVLKNPLDLVNPWRSNPFRGLAKIVGSLNDLFFLGHVTSIGMCSNHVDLGFIPSMPPIPAPVATAVGAGSEWFTDLNYLEKDNHKFILLRLLFLPLNLTAGILNCFAVGWDYTFSSSPRDFKKSCENIFTIHRDNEPYPKPIKPLKPPRCEEWEKQEILEVCDAEKNRLSHQNPMQKLMNKSEATREKIKLFDDFKRDVKNGTALSDEQKPNVTAQSFSFHRNRFGCFAGRSTKSQNKVFVAMANYDTEKRHSMAP